MSLNKKKMVREIGRRTRLKNRDVERVIETLIDVWTEELVAGGRIEIENFLALLCYETQTNLKLDDRERVIRTHWRVRLSVSKRLQNLLYKVEITE